MTKPENSKLIVLDIDNTINTKNLNGEIQLVKEFIELHTKIDLKKNIKIAYNTTRGISRVLEMLKGEQEYFGNGVISALNGSLIYDLKSMQQLEGYTISAETRKMLSEWFVESTDITFMAFYTNNDIYGHVYLKDANTVDEFYKLHESSFNHEKYRCISDPKSYASWIEQKDINMIEFKTANENKTNKFIINNPTINFSFDGHFYINPKGINKGSGLRDLIKFLYKDESNLDTIVAGDSKTDLAMFLDSNYMNIIVGERLQEIRNDNYTRVRDPKELCSILSKLL